MSFLKFTTALGLAAVLGVAPAVAQERILPRPGSQPAPPATGERENPSNDLRALAGAWTVKWVETHGEALFDLKTHDETLPPPTFTFTGNRCEVRGIKASFVRDFSFRIDEHKAPKEIDVTFLDGPKKGDTFVGIYLVRDDEVRICLRLQGLQLGRPKGYVTNSGTTLYTFILTRPARASEPVRGTTTPLPQPPAPAVPAPPFDAVLRSGSKLYFVTNRPAGSAFEADVAAVAQRIDHAAKAAEGFQNVTLVLFTRADAKATEGSQAALSAAQLRDVAGVPADKRAAKLTEHAWTPGRLPADAVPVPAAPPPALPEKAVSDRGGRDALTADALVALTTLNGRNLDAALGKLVELTGSVVSTSQAVDGSRVTLVQLDAPHAGALPYTRAYAHNVPGDATGRAGDRVALRGRVVSHGYGAWRVWCDRWALQPARSSE